LENKAKKIELEGRRTPSVRLGAASGQEPMPVRVEENASGRQSGASVPIQQNPIMI
jgi:hypothetical protein